LRFEAQLRGMTIGALVTEVIVAVLKKGLFETVLRK
jgi:glucose uptake protein GlcU